MLSAAVGSAGAARLRAIYGRGLMVPGVALGAGCAVFPSLAALHWQRWLGGTSPSTLST